MKGSAGHKFAVTDAEACTLSVTNSILEVLGNSVYYIKDRVNIWKI